MHVYFIKAFCDPPLVKIGRSWAVSTRVRALSAACPFPLELIGAVECPDQKRLVWAELGIHERLAAHRHYGEWFRLNEEVEEYVRGILSGSIPVPDLPERVKKDLQENQELIEMSLRAQGAG